jgi:two-component system, chemotaxis family, chemotaxis protein CheY
MSLRVLVVDDSGFMRKRIIEELRALGHSVIGEAKSGDEAVKMYASLRPDLVTMDITMRDKDGITAAKEIMEADPTANIIFLTILKDEKFKVEAERIGAKAFLNKADTTVIGKVLEELETKQKNS